MGCPAPTLSPEQFIALKADVVLIKPCGFSIERSLSEKPLLERVVTLAGKQARVYLSDGNAFFNRPGPRLVESLEILAACVHPAVFLDFARKHADVIVRLS
jgi:iron complex transport system substrate-binding protein